MDKGTDDVIKICFCFFVMYYEADNDVVMHLFSNRSQKTSKCSKNISDMPEKFTDSVTHSGNGLREYFLFYRILMLSVIYSRHEKT